jgi:DNA polymerase-3 subunit delta'
MLFSDIAGNKEVKKKLIETVLENRISHAQLFLGKKGSGNLALAFAYAQFISCIDKKADDACNACSSCVKYKKWVHPDLHITFPFSSTKEKPYCKSVLPEFREMMGRHPYPAEEDWYQALNMGNKQGIIPRDEAEDIVRTLSLTTYESEYKTVVIWLPEKMNTVAANVLLKTLEEPPRKTLFILVAESLEQILPTILSRTQIVRVASAGLEEMTEALTRMHGVDEKQARDIAYMADGDMHAAMQSIAPEKETIHHPDQFLNWMRSCYAFSSNMVNILAISETLGGLGRERQKDFLMFGLQMIRESMLLHCNVNLSRFNDEEQKTFQKFSALISPSVTQRLLDEFNLALSHVERNGNWKIIFLDLSMKAGAVMRAGKPSS